MTSSQANQERHRMRVNASESSRWYHVLEYMCVWIYIYICIYIIIYTCIKHHVNAVLHICFSCDIYCSSVCICRLIYTCFSYSHYMVMWWSCVRRVHMRSLGCFQTAKRICSVMQGCKKSYPYHPVSTTWFYIWSYTYLYANSSYARPLSFGFPVFLTILSISNICTLTCFTCFMSQHIIALLRLVCYHFTIG